MARKMDAHVDTIAEYERISADITKIGREKRNLEQRKSALEAQLLKSMGASIEGTINGVTAIKVVDSERRSVSVKTVEQVCPTLMDKLVTVNKSRKIKVV